MKRFLFASSILISLFSVNSCATRNLDFNKDKDVVTCAAGSYTITKNSTADEVKKFCNVTGASHNVKNGAPPVLEFWTDQHARIICSFVKGKVEQCKFVK